MRQYEVDFERFIMSLSRLTGISKEFIKSYVEKKSMNSLFFDKSPPPVLTKAQVRKLELIKEFKILYELETDRQAGFKLNSSSKSGSYFIDYYRKQENRQYLCAAYLNNSNTLISVKQFDVKDLKHLVKNKKAFIKDILDHNATNVILSRYNPLNYRMSEEDRIAITQLIMATKDISIKILDFINVNPENNYFSYMENGYWPDIISTVNSLFENSLSETNYSAKGDINISAEKSNREKLSSVMSRLTGVKADKLGQYFKDNQVKNIFEVNQGNLTLKQKERLASLKETKNFLPNILNNEIRGDYILDSPHRISEYFRNYFSNIVDKEYFLVTFLDERDRIIKTLAAFEGTVNECPIYVREMIKAALEIKSSRVILAHNHPGGSTIPSKADKDVTSKINEAFKQIDVEVKDHIIVAGKHTVSIKGICPELFQGTLKDFYNNQCVLERPSVAGRIQTAEQKSVERSKNPKSQKYHLNGRSMKNR